MNVQRPVAALSLDLPTAGGRLETFRMSALQDFPDRVSGSLNRVALAAAHVVADPFAEADPWLQAAPDWDRTIAFREHLWDLGLGVAEAMDTAQRGMGLDWPMALELIRRSVAAARARGAVVFSGAGTDHLDPAEVRSIDDVIRAYEEQFAAIEAVGGRIILMASRALARVAKSPRRLRQGLRPHPRPGARAGHHPLARRHVRPGAGGLLGRRRLRGHARDRRRRHQRQRCQGRRG
jgi:hypothetical protein